MYEVEKTEKPCALMQVQWLECVGNVNQALAFWDTGSNVNLVRKKFAKMAGWESLPVVQQLQTTGRGGEDWHTTAYWVTLVTEHNLLFFEIDTITASMAPVDVTPVLGLFGGASLTSLTSGGLQGLWTC